MNLNVTNMDVLFQSKTSSLNRAEDPVMLAVRRLSRSIPVVCRVVVANEQLS